MRHYLDRFRYSDGVVHFATHAISVAGDVVELADSYILRQPGDADVVEYDKAQFVQLHENGHVIRIGALHQCNDILHTLLSKITSTGLHLLDFTECLVLEQSDTAYLLLHEGKLADLQNADH